MRVGRGDGHGVGVGHGHRVGDGHRVGGSGASEVIRSRASGGGRKAQPGSIPGLTADTPQGQAFASTPRAGAHADASQWLVQV